MSGELQHRVSGRKGTLHFLRLLAKAIGVASGKGNVSGGLLELSRRGDCLSEIRVFSRDPAQKKRRIRLRQKATAVQVDPGYNRSPFTDHLSLGFIWDCYGCFSSQSFRKAALARTQTLSAPIRTNKTETICKAIGVHCCPPAGYFPLGAREATIFSKRGSPRSGSQNGCKRSSP